MYRNYKKTPKKRPQNGGGRKSQPRNARSAHSTMDVDQLINKVNDDAFIKPAEHVLQHQFDDFKIDLRLKRNIAEKGYISPTPIQDQAIPLGLEGRDVIGIANTGTGKTAAFLIPLINKMLGDKGEQALIVAPTRELAFQIDDELNQFAKGFGLTSVLCIGGTNLIKQQRALRHRVNFVIGTPGRLVDLMNRKSLDLHSFKNVVLDEADRMVDMGFIRDIRLLLGKLPIQRQSLFFTATLESKVEELIRKFMNNPEKVSVKIRHTSANIEQDIIHVPSNKTAKQKILTDLLHKPEFEKVLIFCRTKHGANKLVTGLHESRIKAVAIHGNKSQNYRIKALTDFKKDDIKVLVATDVAARGLDINGVSHVINYDIPANYDDYVHRIGRTGRADQHGKALTFVTQEP